MHGAEINKSLAGQELENMQLDRWKMIGGVGKKGTARQH